LALSELSDYVAYPLTFRQVEDILHERYIDAWHKAIPYWVGRLAKKIHKKRVEQYSNWQWRLDQIFVKN